MAVSDKSTASMKRRIIIVAPVLLTVLAVIVAVRMFKISVIDNAKYQEIANNQQFGSRVIKANRGTIYDRNGQVLAQSITVYNVFVDPRVYAERDKDAKYTPTYEDENGDEVEGDPIPKTEIILDTLSSILNVSRDDIQKKLDKNNAYQVIARDVDKVTADAIEAAMNKAGITSVGLEQTSKRYYPQNDLAAAVIGHLGYDAEGVYRAIYGVENYYDSYLTGTDGRVVIAQTGTYREMQYKYSQSYDAKDGDTLYTNIDATIQYYVEKALQSAVIAEKPLDRACAIVMNAKTGAIYAMASEPDYDLNAPLEVYDESILAQLALLETEGKTEEYQALKASARNKQWSNKAVAEIYFPGSVFKVVTGSAALEEHAVSLNDHFSCGGSIKVDGLPFHCWTKTPSSHAGQNFAMAMANSCNPAFVQIGQKLGAKKFSSYLEAFGFTEKTGIDLPGEAKGVTVASNLMTPVNLASSSFGQANKITPMQMICAYAAVVNGGHLVTPYVVDKIVDSDGNVVKEFTPTIKRQVISEETSATMREVLEGVVNVNAGTNAYIPGFRIGGKSGTSQKLDKEFNGEESYVSSYCAFFPANDPEIIMLVMVDDPTAGRYYGSAVAAPVVSEVFRNILPYLGYYAEYTADEIKDLEATVPNVRDAAVSSAKATIKSCGLECQVIGNGSTVIRQVPSSGSSMPKGCKVIVYTEETEAKLVTVPDITGYSLDKANKKLNDLGLNLRPIGGAAEKSGAICSRVEGAGGLVEVGSIIEANFIINNETG